VLNAGFAAIAGFLLTHATFQWGALRIVPAFLFGSALYLAWRGGAASNPKMALSGAILSSLIVVVTASLSRSEGLTDTLIVVTLGLMVLSVAGLERAGTGILSSSVLVYLGEISFAVYMVYVPWKWVFLKAARTLLGLDHQALPFVWWLAGLLALVPLAMLAHHTVELPFRRIIRLWGEKIVNKFAYKWAKQG